MKTKIYLFIIMLFNVMVVFGQTPNWEWAKNAGGTLGNDFGKSIAVDANGNSYITGYFESATILFGSITLTNTNPWVGGGPDFFIVKYDASGNVIWANVAGGTAHDYGNSITVDASGNSYITGFFDSPTITFSGITLTNTAAFPTTDIFIVKYDTFGNIIWAKNAGGTDSEIGNSITSDTNGNLYITGWFNSTTITFGSTTLANAGGSDIFIAKYDTSGNVLWAKSAGGIGSDAANSITTNVNNLFITGYFWSPTITFGSTTIINTSSVYSDVFIAKYDTSGNVIWAKSAEGNYSDHSNSITADANGNSCITGYFQSDTITFDSTSLSNAGLENIFIAKYDSSGNVLWAKSAGGTSDDEGNSVSTDANGNSYLTGLFWSSSISFDSITLANAGSSDIFIAKYNTSGNVLWAKSVGGIVNDESNSIEVDTNGYCYITGTFGSATLTFGSTTLTNASGGYFNVVVAKLGITTGIAENSNSVNEVTIYPNPSGNGQFKIESSKNIDEIKITNMLGQIIYQTKPNENFLSLQLDKAGIYYIQITTDKQTIMKNLIVCK